jgi:hypothetical protein
MHIFEFKIHNICPEDGTRVLCRNFEVTKKYVADIRRPFLYDTHQVQEITDDKSVSYLTTLVLLTLVLRVLQCIKQVYILSVFSISSFP